jgi:hypothetical protein
MYRMIVAMLLFLVSCCVLPTLVFAERVSEERDVPSFHSVDLRTVGNISLTQGDAQSLVIRTESDVLRYLETEVRDGVLVISSRRNIRKYDAPDMVIKMKKARSLRISGSGEIQGQNRIVSKSLDLVISGSGTMVLELEAEQLNTKVSGSGDMFLEVEAKTLTTHISGSGDVEVSGKSGDLEVKISGSGSLSAYDLETLDAYIRISGSGSCRVRARELLDVNVSGSGDVVYMGNPKVSLTGSGSGSVRAR